MKIKSFLVSIFLSGATIVLVTSCGSKKEEHSMDHEPSAVADEQLAVPMPPQFEVDVEFQQQVSTIFASYVSMKEAFVASDASKVDKEAFKVQGAVSGIDAKSLSSAALNDWKIYQDELIGALKGIQSTDDLEKKRAAFSAVTDNLYKSIKAFGLGGAIAYYEYCPMAFNNAGAYWLSDNAVIRNPYFGDKMLKCGSVEEELH
ncbi:MAG: DUF3347 domain-containing protein [Cyclobacteriaceae bacterium]|nr:DUF3347 domain-containing protein [Cyclobacteriaceae bacterium]